MVAEQVQNEARGSAAEQSTYSLSPSIELKWREHFKKKEEDRNRPIELELPSGLSIMAVRASMRWLLNHDRIPDPLMASVEEMIALIESEDPNKAEETLRKELEEDTETAFMKWLSILNTCWLACVVSPEFTDDNSRYDATEPPYHVASVEYFDKMYLYQWAQGVDQSVIDFFREQAEALAGLQPGEDIRVSPTSDLRVDRFGRPVASVDGGSSGFSVGELHTGPNRRARRKARSTKKRSSNNT